ncbi:MAG: C-GCAxxG-C-C family (seleno)protein, partial [Anaerovoracaceae bacterium]
MDRKEMAVNLHKSGFNCAQSVACSFCHVMGYEPETVFKLSEGFGAGMGTFNTGGAGAGMG